MKAPLLNWLIEAMLVLGFSSNMFSAVPEPPTLDELEERSRLAIERTRKQWFEDPETSLRNLAHSDDLIFTKAHDALLLEASSIFAEAAVKLAATETEFGPLYWYAVLGFDQKDVTFARKVIKKAIETPPDPHWEAELKLLPLVEMYGSVAQVEDAPFFKRVASNTRFPVRVREAANAVVVEINRKTPASNGSASEFPEDPAKSPDEESGEAPSKASESESERLWVIGAALLVICGGGIFWRLAASRR